MKSIIKFAVSNPVTICMLVLAILLLGKISYDQLAVDLLPDLNNPRLFIELKANVRRRRLRSSLSRTWSRWRFGRVT